MKKLILLVFFTSLPLSNEAFAFDTSYFGKYGVYDIRDVGGGIASDDVIEKWKIFGMCVSHAKFSVRSVFVENPRYGISLINLKVDSEVDDRSMPYSYGVEIDRNPIRVLGVYRKKDKEAYVRFEFISQNRLVEIYDGRLFFYRKVSDKC
ncbi:hypothetical protein ACO0K2_17425 [Undibacterium sp. MH2W]|uniref:hypothetical protein n=1 Tax=Undibacterium sp. MH2W TaxID=3413044 RepID=UPI003BF249DB